MLKGISLFSNIGIGELGLPSDIQIVVANELLKDRADFYAEIHPNTKMIQGSILDENVFEALIEESRRQGTIDFLIATPPCQAMSTAGKMLKDDPRNALILPALEYVKQIQPKFILIENVKGMKKTLVNGVLIPEIIESTLRPLGYQHINHYILDTADYGIPQHRKRIFFLISKEQAWLPPQKAERKISIKEAIDHLPSIESGDVCTEKEYEWHYGKKHNARHIEWMQHTKSGDTAFNNPIHYPKKANGEMIKAFKNTYKRMNPHNPAPTITMSNGAISSQQNVHYGREMKNEHGEIIYSDSRVLSILELLILMSIPLDRFVIPKGTSENFLREVIGEGIPSKMISLLMETCPYK